MKQASPVAAVTVYPEKWPERRRAVLKCCFVEVLTMEKGGMDAFNLAVGPPNHEETMAAADSSLLDGC